MPPRSYPTVPLASAEVRNWVRQQILSAHYVIQAKGFEALRGVEERELVMRGVDAVFSSVQGEMLDNGELEVLTSGWVAPGPNIPDHPLTPRRGVDGFRPGRNLAQVRSLDAPRVADPCPNCGSAGVLAAGTPVMCANCLATITTDEDGYLAIEIQPERERAIFTEKYGATPEAWLANIRQTDICALSGYESSIYYRAMLLEQRSE